MGEKRLYSRWGLIRGAPVSLRSRSGLFRGLAFSILVGGIGSMGSFSPAKAVTGVKIDPLGATKSTGGPTLSQLKRAYPTFEAAAHHHGAVDLAFTDRSHLIATLAFPGHSGQGHGLARDLMALRNLEPMAWNLDHVLVRTGSRAVDLASSRRTELSLTEGGRILRRGQHLSCSIGYVDSDLRARFDGPFDLAYPTPVIYIPELDGLFTSPFTAPRAPYTSVKSRRSIGSRGSIELMRKGGRIFRARVEWMPRRDSDVRDLAIQAGHLCRIIGEARPFSDPRGWGKDKTMYEAHAAKGIRRLALALYNEIGAPEQRSSSVQPTPLTVIYGVEIHERYLAGFDPVRGPIIDNLDQ